MKFYLIVAKGKRQGEPVEVTADLYLIGSEKICQMRATHLAPKHCAIVRRDGKVFVRDMGSGEATFVNDEVIVQGDEWPLHAGDRLAFGKFEFVVQFQEQALSRKDLEEWAATCLDVARDVEYISEDEDSEFLKPTTASAAAQNIIDKLSAQKGEVVGRLRVGFEYGITTVRFNDPMMVEEAEISHIRKELWDHINRANLRVLLDCKNLRRISTSGVIMLRDVHKRLQSLGSTMALCRLREDVKPILSVLDADNLPVFPDKRTAILAKW